MQHSTLQTQCYLITRDVVPIKGLEGIRSIELSDHYDRLNKVFISDDSNTFYTYLMAKSMKEVIKRYYKTLEDTEVNIIEADKDFIP